MGLRSLYVNFRRRQIYGRCLAAPSRLTILRYHAVGHPEEVGAYLDPGLSVAPDRFREQVRFLSENFDLVLPDDIPALSRRTAPLRRAIAITFDDGYRDNHDVALPILEEFGARASFYVTTTPVSSGHGLWISELWRLVPRLPTGPFELDETFQGDVPSTAEGRWLLRRKITRHFAGLTATAREQALDTLAELAGIPRGEGLARSFLDEDRVRSLAAAGMGVGAHSRTHPHLDHLPPEFHEEEVLGSKQDLEAILGRKIPHFAYPNPSGSGRFSQQARASVEAAGFSTALTSKAEPIGGSIDLLRVPRLGVYSGPQEKLLFRLLAKAARA